MKKPKKKNNKKFQEKKIPLVKKDNITEWNPDERVKSKIKFISEYIFLYGGLHLKALSVHHPDTLNIESSYVALTVEDGDSEGYTITSDLIGFATSEDSVMAGLIVDAYLERDKA